MSQPEPTHFSQPSALGPSETETSPPQQPNLTQIYLGLSSYPFAQDPEYQAGLATILGHPETPATPEEIEREVDLVLQAQCFYVARKYNVPVVDPTAYAAWLRDRERERESEQEAQAGAGGRIEEAGQPTLPLLPPQGQTQADSSSNVESTATAPLSSTGPADPTPQTQQPPHAQPNADDQQPPYPTSFAAIVDLITRNIPVPGIEEIPTTVLEPGSSKVDKTPRRRKPWEKETEQDGSASLSAEGESEKKEGDDTAAGTSGVDTGGDASDAAVVDVYGHRETGTGVVNILKPNAVPDSGLLSKD